MTEKEQVYQTNIRILYKHLEDSIGDYINIGHICGKTEYVNAYVMAVLGAIVAYYDTVVKPNKAINKIQEEKCILACKYANNMLKHDPSIVTHVRSKGGLTFPMAFPVSIDEIEVVWKWQDLPTNHPDQKDAFQDLFADKQVLETLQTVLTHLGIDI